VRRRKADLSQRVNGDLRVEFSAAGLTSYAGLELFIRYLRSIELNRLIRRHFAGSGVTGDFGVVSMVRLLIALLVVGGRRLQHAAFLNADPLVLRFCALVHLPAVHTVSRWLKRFTEASLKRLRAVNAEVVAQAIAKLPVTTLTIDVDGTVNSTGMKVERAFRGFNPHRRKVPSYYPITGHVAETGHILRVKNRSGDVHDGKKSIGFLRDVFSQVTETLGRGYRLNFRLDGAYFLREIIQLLGTHGAGYAIKVPFWRWLDLQSLIRVRTRWDRINADVDAFEQQIVIEKWRMVLRVVLYRKRVHHRTAKNYQLDMFDPANGTYEYSAVATNLTLDPRRLWNFMCGRGAHEKAIGELKTGLAFDTIPTNHYGANSAWQQIVVLTHNLLTNFQIETGAGRRARSQKRTTLFVLKSVRTLRFEIFSRAGEIAKPAGATVLRLARNAKTEALFLRIAHSLSQAA
jgi:hypothetical protein